MEMKTKLFFTGLALMALTAMVNAQTSGTDKTPQNPSGKRLAFVDANKNGICDNFENRITTVPAGNRSGNCRRCAQGKQMGQGMGRGMGRGRRMAQGQKSGNFVDVNKNGVCDFFEGGL